MRSQRWTVPTEDFPSCSRLVVDGIPHGQKDEGFQCAVDADNGSIGPWEFAFGGIVDVQHCTVSVGVAYSAGPARRVWALATPTDLEGE